MRGYAMSRLHEPRTALSNGLAGSGLPFAPSGRVFREWVELDNPDEASWADLLEEAQAFAASKV